MSCLIAPLQCVIGGTASSLGAGIMQVFVGWYVSGIGGLLQVLAQSLTLAHDAPLVLHAAALTGRTVLPLTVPVALLALFGGIIVTVMRPDGLSGLVAMAWRVPVVMVSAVAAPLVAAVVLRAVDAVTGSVASGLSGALASFADRAAHHAVLVTFGSFLVVALAVTATVLLWLEIVLRQVVLVVLVCAAPLVVVLATTVTGRQLARRFLQLFVGAAVAKIVFVLVVLCGLDLAGAPGLNALAVGSVTLLLAVWSPVTVIRLLPLVDAGAFAVADGVRSRWVRHAVTAGTMASRMSGAFPAVVPTPPTPGDDHDVGYWPAGQPMELPPVPDTSVPLPDPPIGRAHLLRRKFVPSPEPGVTGYWHELN
jgi:hypothetical protein